MEVGQRYVGQAPLKTERGKRRIGLHPLLVAALRRHRDESIILGTYDVADLVGHIDPRTTEGYRHQVRPALPHAIEAWNHLLDRPDS